MYLQSDTSAAIRQIQKYLYEIHLHDQLSYIIIPDGIYGSATKKAVTEFQERKNLPSTGIVDIVTFGALRETAKKYSEENRRDSLLYSKDGYPLRIGSQGADVDVLHALLRSLSEYEKEFPPIPRAAYFSAETARAVQYMQRVFRFNESGIVNAELFERLENELKARQNLQN